MKNKYNFIRPPVFKSHRYRVGNQSNQKLLHHYQHAKISSVYTLNLKIRVS